MGKNVRPYCGQTDPSGTCDYVYRAFPCDHLVVFIICSKRNLYGADGITCDSKEKSGFWCQAVWKNWYGRLGFWDFSTYFIPRHASFSIEFVDSGIDDFNGCYLDFVSSVPYRITHR